VGNEDNMETAYFKVVTYNSWQWEDHWSTRLYNFAKDVVAVDRPAIIGMQEISLRTQNCGSSCWNKCPDIDRQQYLKTLLDYIYEFTGVHYEVASSLRTNHSMPFGICPWTETWHGEGTLYDPNQVTLIPYDVDKGVDTCGNWAQNGGKREEFNDCVLMNFSHSDYFTALVRNIFKFPIGSLD